MVTVSLDGRKEIDVSSFLSPVLLHVPDRMPSGHDGILTGEPYKVLLGLEVQSRLRRSSKRVMMEKLVSRNLSTQLDRHDFSESDSVLPGFPMHLSQQSSVKLCTTDWNFAFCCSISRNVWSSFCCSSVSVLDISGGREREFRQPIMVDEVDQRASGRFLMVSAEKSECPIKSLG
jgi:hypothetical protein